MTTTQSAVLLMTAATLSLSCQAAPDPAVDADAEVQEVVADSSARQLLAEIVPEVVQEPRYASSNNFVGEPLPGYGRAIVLLRNEAATALAKVQRRLESDGLGLKVWDGYRPVRATLAMVAWTERVGRTDLLDDGYIARRSRHNQGVAVDLTVIELDTGEELDMGTAYDSFESAAHTANATGEVAHNRAILVGAMEAEGFTNYQNEWWHFSFEVVEPVPFDLPLEDW